MYIYICTYIYIYMYIHEYASLPGQHLAGSFRSIALVLAHALHAVQARDVLIRVHGDQDRGSDAGVDLVLKGREISLSLYIYIYICRHMHTYVHNMYKYVHLFIYVCA